MNYDMPNGEAAFTDQDSRLAAMSVPLETLTAITGVAPDFQATRDALDIQGPMPLGYVDLYRGAVSFIAAARRSLLLDSKTTQRPPQLREWLGNTAVQQQLAEQLEPQARRLAIINKLSAFFGRDDLPWRDYQKETVLETLRFLTKGASEIIKVPSFGAETLRRYGYNDLPTGSGKTVSMALTALGAGIGTHVSDRYPRKLRGAVICPTLNLLAQVRGNDDRGFARFAPSIKMVQLDHKHTYLPEDWDMLVMTYRRMLNMLNDGTARELGLDIVFLDEGHHALGERFRPAILDSDIPIVIATTATPDYNETKRLMHVFPHQLERIDPTSLIERGVLSGLHILEVNTGAQFDISGFTNSGGFLEKDLEVLSHDQLRNRKIRDNTVSFIEAGVPTAISLLPGDRCYHARSMAEELSKIEIIIGGKKRHIIAKAVGDFIKDDGTKMTNEERQQILEDFEAGKIDVLTYVDYLDEGWDSVRLGALLLACPTTSLRKQRQRAGRVARPKPGEPVKWILEFVDNQITRNQVLAVDLYDEGGTEPELVIGPSDVRQFVMRKPHGPVQPSQSDNKRAKGHTYARSHEMMFPFVSEEVARALDQTRVLLLDQRRIEAVRLSEMPPAGWPSFSHLRSLRPDMEDTTLVSALRGYADIYDQRIRARSQRGKHDSWEIYYPPEAETIVLRHDLLDYADHEQEATLSTLERETGISHRILRRIINARIKDGDMKPLSMKRSPLNGRTYAYIPRDQIPAIVAMADRESVTAELVSVQALALLLGRTPKVLKEELDGAQATIHDLNRGDGRGGHVDSSTALMIATQHPRVPDVPEDTYKTEEELLAILGIGKPKMKYLAEKAGVRPGKYVLRGENEHPFIATCYSPEQIVKIVKELNQQRNRPGSKDPRTIAEQRSRWSPPTTIADEDPHPSPEKTVEGSLRRIVRNENGRKYLPTLVGHFVPKPAGDRIQLDSRAKDLLHVMEKFYTDNLRRERLARTSPDTVGILALKLLLGSRKDASDPRNFDDVFQQLREAAARQGIIITQDEVLQQLTAELDRLITSIELHHAD